MGLAETERCTCQLADTIEQRSAAVARWKQIYWDQFIPFAHGVRRLATYYNDAVRPEDPYEFVGLWRNQPLIAIQPKMTHLVPLAGAIVERRGGILIHGAIIARELGIPCVNGVRKAADVPANGDLVTVDGFLGIVTVGPAEFDLELR